jgi:serine/threonine-protein kinase RIO1
LRFYGVATPAPLALVEERFGPLRRRGFLINEFCPGDDLLHLLAPEREPATDMARAIIDLFRTLHALRISHGDLKASNLLWHEGRVVIIDLDALVEHRSAYGHARAWRRDRERLLRNWPAASRLHHWLDANLPVAAQAK